MFGLLLAVAGAIVRPLFYIISRAGGILLSGGNYLPRIKYPFNRGYTINSYKLSPDMQNWLADKHCIYLLCIRPGLYKFGITSNIIKRLATHRRVIGYEYVMKIYVYPTRRGIIDAETEFKRYAKSRGILTEYRGQHEIVKCKESVIIKWFDHH